MEVKSKLKHTRVSPRKTRLVVDLVRGKKAKEALDQLRFLHKRASIPVRKVIESAVANAEHNYELKKDNLYIKEIRVDEGRTLHRWMPRAYGRATPIRKRTSHINVVLGEIVDSGEVEPKKQEVEAPVSLQDMAQGGQEENKEEKGSEKKSEKKKKDDTSAKKKEAKTKDESKAEKEPQQQEQEKKTKK